MDKKKRVQKKKRSGSTAWRLYVIIALVLMAIAIAWLVIMPIAFGRLEIRDKQSVARELQLRLDGIKLGVGSEYEKVVDNGCSSDHSVGLQKRLECGLTGYKIVRAGKNYAEHLNALDEKIIAAGFERQLSAHNSVSDFEATLRGDDDKSLRYVSKGTPIKYISIIYFKNKTVADFHIKELIRENKLTEPTGAEFLYGIEASEGYYSCEPLLFEPCFLEPVK